jgi:hypothetical protein
LHLSASEGREILTKILKNTPCTSTLDDPLEDVVETAPEEEPMIVEPEPLATPLEASTILQVLEPTKEEEIPLLEEFKFEEYLFSNFRNTSNYSAIRKSSAPSAPNQQAFWCRCRGAVAVLVLSQSLSFSFSFYHLFITTIIPHAFHTYLQILYSKGRLIGASTIIAPHSYRWL